MRILHICPEYPSSKSGGGIAIKQSLISMKNSNYEVDYIGPEILEEDIEKMYNNVLYLYPTTNKLARLFNLFMGISNSRYNDWKKVNINTENYDVVVIEFSKLRYLIKKLVNLPKVVRVHNVEYDFAWTYYRLNKNISNLYVALLSKINERKLLKSADVIVTLTEKDKNRLCGLYGVNASRFRVNPICVEEDKMSQSDYQGMGEIKLLITGSLWYGPNYVGVKWFLENVYKHLKCNAHIRVAGSNPNDELKREIVQYKNAEIIENPVSMKEHFDWCDLVVAPVFDGAGMKVKVAEAMSHKKPVIGTSHAFIGYKIRDKINSYIADLPEEFVAKIEEVSHLSTKDYQTLVAEVEKLFVDNYSLKSSTLQWKEIIDCAAGRKG